MKYTMLVCLLAATLIAATCGDQDMREYLTAGTAYEAPEKQAVDYVLVLDRSGSMRGEKIEQAKAAAIELVNQLEGEDRAAVIAFDREPTLQQSFSKDKETLSAAINAITPGDFTQYRPALELAQSQFNGNAKVVVFLSDGKSDDDPDAIMDSVRSMIAQDICLFTIAYAESADQQAQELLEDIAAASEESTTCGGYFRARENEFELQWIFSNIYQQVSSEELFDVRTEVQGGNPPELKIHTVSKLNNRPVEENECFTPSYTILITRGNEIIKEINANSSRVPLSVPPGDYTYFITSKEACGGDCLFTGSATGDLRVEDSDLACKTPWDELGVLLSSTEYVEVHITENGFSPQSISTDGTVVWRNLDTKPHRVLGLNEEFRSPILDPGETFEFVFPPGTYTYTDAAGTVSGALANQDIDEHLPVDLIVIIDKSGSMAGRPLASAKAAANNLLAVMAPTDRGSLIAFSDTSTVLQSLTSDVALLEIGVDALYSDGSTFYTQALMDAGSQLRRSSADRNKVVIFLSDGAPYDIGGREAILKTVQEELRGSCLYAIGYGEQGREATELLANMAQLALEENGCGIFYLSDAEKTQLSKVFGEIYAQTQEAGLEVVDIIVTDEKAGEIDVSVRVRSRKNGVLIPSVSGFGCVPEAEVYAHILGQKFPLVYSQGAYRGTIALPPGEYKGTITARLSDPDLPSRIIVGSEAVTITIKGRPIWLFALGTALIILALYVFMRRRHSKRHASRIHPRVHHKQGYNHPPPRTR